MIYFNRPAPMPTGILSCEVADPRAYYLLFEPTPQNGPEAPRTDVRRPNAPANGVTHEIAAILPATEEPETRVCFECGQEIDLAEDHTDDDGHYYHEWCCPVCIQRDRELYHAATA